MLLEQWPAQAPADHLFFPFVNQQAQPMGYLFSNERQSIDEAFALVLRT